MNKTVNKTVKKIIIIIICVCILVTAKVMAKIIINNKFIANYPDADQEYRLVLLSTLNLYEPYIAPYNYGNYLYQKGRFEEAYVKYKNALKYKIPKKRYCDVKINISLTLIKLSEDEKISNEQSLEYLKEAQKHLNQCLMLKPDEEDFDEDDLIADPEGAGNEGVGNEGDGGEDSGEGGHDGQDDNGKSDGEKSDGEKSDGEKSDGEKSDGEKSDGEKKDGAGQVKDKQGKAEDLAGEVGNEIKEKEGKENSENKQGEGESKGETGDGQNIPNMPTQEQLDELNKTSDKAQNDREAALTSGNNTEVKNTQDETNIPSCKKCL